jgi:hypothetical protein
VLVQALNVAPVVDAGEDLALTLPTQTVRITGAVTDDGRILSDPVITWTQEGGPLGVSFVPANAAVTDATFPGAGVFILRLSANDGQLTAFDEVEVTVDSEPPPTVDIEDVAVVEGQEGLSGASLEVKLSKPWVRPVSVDYVTVDGTATHPCDYRRRYGTLEVPPGNTVGTVLVPVVGDW